ncbi:valine--tRNA ligase [Mycoplasma sp. ATU-Cv-703]|uniref:valine--tRNA ligase n=1 Tax=Mycoplasma sp. ATU-Cv-703 TaxID=2498595 RepID=UPI001374E5C1
MEVKYDHRLVEKGRALKWVRQGYFSTHQPSLKKFSLILPPPNVTGELHLGHAWNAYIQDTLVRFKKLEGYDVLWLPAVDHAGIATQVRVEQHLFKVQKTTRHELGRAKFIKEVWKWKNLYAQKIVDQWQKLGLALDYNHQKFTMDEDLVQAVNQAFITLYQRKLIYRGIRAINWDPKLQTVISNIEVENRPVASKMYYFEYVLVDGIKKLLVATTRPETMFSDVALAVNPSDKRYASLVGQKALSPLTGAVLPIIASTHVEHRRGSGVMKVSAHAAVDVEIIQANRLPLIESIDRQGKMNSNAQDLVGLDRFQARKVVVDRLKKSGALVKEEDTTSYVGFSQRSNEVIEILVQPQWFIKIAPLARRVLENLDSAQGSQFFPPRFKGVLKTWVKNAHDWTISRQLWWGHRIPAWYLGDKVKVQSDSPGPGWRQDEDVLDTWFSSALGPFSFLGWPRKKTLLQDYYPLSILVTGYDIIFFWVARMYFFGLEFTGQTPFQAVLLNGLIRDEEGQKMSKSRDNGIDPTKVVDKYGSDALRWFLLTNSTPGQDIRFSYQKIAAAWNLLNKLWNVSRYIMHVMPHTSVQKPSDTDLWIEKRLALLAKTLTKKLDQYQLTLAGQAISQFIQEDLSSWYVEFSKTEPNYHFASQILSQLLVLVHPFLPFLSDYLFEKLTGEELLEKSWPTFKTSRDVSYIDRVISLTRALREFRALHQISHRQKIFYDSETKLKDSEEKMLNHLVNGERKTNRDVLLLAGSEKIYAILPAEQIERQKKRQTQQLTHLASEIKRAEDLLANVNFQSKAPREKVKLEKTKLAQLKDQLKKLKSNLLN